MTSLNVALEAARHRTEGVGRPEENQQPTLPAWPSAGCTRPMPLPPRAQVWAAGWPGDPVAQWPWPPR